MTLTAIWELGFGSRPILPTDNRTSEADVQHVENEILTSIGFYNTPNESKEQYENIFGLTSAVTSLVFSSFLSYPFISIRNRHQVFPTKSPTSNHPFQNLSVLKEVIRKEGLRSLWVGYGAGLLCQSAFVVYETGCNVVSVTGNRLRSKSDFPRRVWDLGMASVHFLLYIPLYPFYRTSVLLRLGGYEANRLTSKSEVTSIKRLTLDFWGSLLRPRVDRIPWTTLTSAYIHHYIFDYVQAACHLRFCRLLLSTKKSNKRETMLHSFFPELVCVVGSHLLARLITYPMETIVYSLIAQDGRLTDTKYTSLLHCALSIWRERGWRGLYSGMNGFFVEACVSWTVLEGTYYIYTATANFLDWVYR
ncbi:mitochondrial carrier [Basidiobolus meristosporus CBS 931.73]|uniref:Mitochondrial carrier n=1 Tax=Basidiobolus meristosporus CBS 931.73 TaxID=1314790 RepID=A0A1Y1Z2W8_9FUNG|nr:mitochondrial carrier [Basidiobolus meristosporus CBS 931.73]|eukprot:ORY04628.1 mitochondrial carrier [Basidiobolus meristosporus CBS 931.73]